MFPTDDHKVYLWNSDSLKNPNRLCIMIIELHPSQPQRKAIHLCICSIYWPNQPSGIIRGKDSKWIRKLVVSYLPGHAGQMLVPGLSHSLPSYRPEMQKFRSSCRLYHEHCSFLRPFTVSVSSLLSCLPGRLVPGRIFLYSRCLLAGLWVGQNDLKSVWKHRS